MAKILSVVLAGIMLVVFIAFFYRGGSTYQTQEAQLKFDLEMSDESDIFDVPEESEATEPTVEASKKVVMVFGGNVNLDSNYTEIDSKYIYGGRNIWRCVDWNIVDFVVDKSDIFVLSSIFPFVDGGEASTGYSFRSTPGNVDFYQKLGVDLISLANDRVLDYGINGLENTLTVFEKSGIGTIGAGKADEAYAPYIFEINERKIGFVSVMCQDNPAATVPTDENVGIAKAVDESYLNAVRAAKGEAEYVVSYVYFGDNADSTVTEIQRETAKKIADAGADIIIGMNRGSVMEAEYYNGSYIFYGIGDFWANDSKLGMADIGALVRVIIDDDDSITVSVVPCVNEGGYTRTTYEKTAEEIYTRLTSLGGLEIQNGNILPKE